MEKYLKKWGALALLFLFLLAFGACSGRSTGEEAKLIYGQWTTEEGVMYTLLENGNFYWHRNKQALNNDYYWGTMEVCSGQDAMDQLEITQEQWDTQYKSMVKSKGQLFCVRLSPNYVMHDGRALENPLGAPPESIIQLRVLVQEDTAAYYNYKTDVSGQLAREEEWISLPEALASDVTLKAPPKQQPEAEENIPTVKIAEDGTVSLTGTLAYNAQWYDSVGKAWKDCYIFVVSQETAQEMAETLGAPEEKNLQEVELFAPIPLEDYVGKKLTAIGTAQAASTTEHKRPLVFYASEIVEG